MKTLTPLVALFLLLGTSPLFAETYTLSPKKSTLKWTGKKVTRVHHGPIQFKKGSIQYKNKKPVSATFIVDMTSIDNSDLKGNMKSKLVGHLRSNDFFSVKKHPTAILNIKEIKPIKGKQHQMKGTLTIKNVSQPAQFNANVEKKGSSTHWKGKLLFDRTKFGIRYRSKNFFKDLGDKIIHDQVEVQFNIEANLKGKS